MPALTCVRNSLISDMMLLLSLATPTIDFSERPRRTPSGLPGFIIRIVAIALRGCFEMEPKYLSLTLYLEARSDEKTGVQNTYVDGCLDQLVRVPLNVRLAKSLRVER